MNELHDLADEIAQLVRTNPSLMARALPAAVAWSPVLDTLDAGLVDEVVITADMAASAERLLHGLVEVADEPLASRLRALEAVVGEGSLVGLTVAEAILRLNAAVKAEEEPAPTISFVPGERGMTSAGRSVMIPAAAHIRGAKGTRWRTDLMVVNPATTPALFTVALLPRDTLNESPEEATLFLEGSEGTFIADVLDALFEFTGAASLRVTADSGAVVVTSRTYNLLGTGNDLGLPVGSTFGQFVPALTDDDAIVSGDQGRLIHLAHDPSLLEGSRANLILVNGNDGTITVEVELYDGTGSEFGTVTHTLRSWEYRQLNNVFEEVTSSTVEDGYAVVRTTTPGGQLYALASVVDNLTGDPIAIPASLDSVLESVSGGSFDLLYIPAAAHVRGARGTNWRTDLVLNSQWHQSTWVDVTLLPRDQENVITPEERFTIFPGESIRVNDVLSTTFDFDGAAALRIRPFGAITASSRTYNLIQDAKAFDLPTGSTFGQYLGAVPLGRALRFGDEGRISHLSHDPSLLEGSRANLGLVNGSNGTIAVEVELFTADGTALGAFTTSLRRFEYRQLNKVFEEVTDQKVDEGYAVVRTTTSFGRLFALGSVVDNRTADPITVDAVPIRSPQPLGLIATVNALFDTLEAGGFDMRAVFDLLSSGDLAEQLDQSAEDLPGYVTRTTDGIVIDVGAGSLLATGFSCGGELELSFSGFDGSGGSADGSIGFELDGFNIDGRSAIVDRVDADFDLESVGGDHVAGTVTLSSSGGKTVTDLTGNLEYDTRDCPTYPIGGSMTVTVGGEQRTVTFSDRCDGGFDYDVPSAEFYRSRMQCRDCDGQWEPSERVIHLVAEDDELTVDPASPQVDETGRGRYTASGRVGYSDAELRFAQPAAKSNVKSNGATQLFGVAYLGERRSYGGGRYYYAGGGYLYAIYGGGCSSSYYHGKNDSLRFFVIENCDGRCTE
jgi:hypothetical protein